MTTETLFSWYYLVFWLPMLAAALLMLISTIRLGHHHSMRHAGAGHAGHLGGHGLHAGHSGATHVGVSHTGAAHPQHTGAAGHLAPSHPAPASAGHQAGNAIRQAAEDAQGAQMAAAHGIHTPGAALMGLIGADRAPLPIVLESFFLFWGFFGFWADRALIHSQNPPALVALPPLAIAFVAGALGARGAAEVAARVLPPEESAVLSREGLFGLTGTVTFPVSETAGRIHVYDEYGTLHDESCRVAAGQPAIEKNRSAIVLDTDEKGHLIVKEVA